MKRAGFTMIELIFVIVILGILSAVALPKFIGVSENAKAGKCKAFVGTLNRTVLPALWSNAMLTDGNVTSDDFNSTVISNQITVPTECGTASQVAAAVAGTPYYLQFGDANYTVQVDQNFSTNESPTLKISK